MNPHFRRQLRLFLYQWHRRAGLASVLVLILVTLTGIALNHTGGLSLDKHYPQAGWLLWPYESSLNTPQGLSVRDHWLWSNGQQLYRDHSALYPCGGLQGGAIADSELLVQCDDQWLWLSVSSPSEWPLMDTLDPGLFGLNSSDRVAASEGAFWVQGKAGTASSSPWQRLDLDLYETSPDQPATPPIELIVSDVPNHISPVRNHTISWQRIVLDIHSGRWFGPLGPWVVDLAALALLFLACSGFWIWYSRRSR